VTTTPTKTQTTEPTQAVTGTQTPTSISTSGKLFPEFSANKTVGMAPLTILFTDETTGGKPVKWSWYLDGKTIETDQPFIHYTFESPGMYTVAVTAFYEQGFFTKTKEDYIDVGTPIQISFTHSKVEGKMPLEVWFTDTSKGSVDTWEWDFGSYGIQTDKNPQIIYNTPGQYPVTLTVSSKKYGGEPGTVSTIINVIEFTGPVRAAFIADPMVGKAPLGVQFIDTSLGSPNGWVWEFGDQSVPSYIQNPFHSFAKSGTYRVTLTAVNNVTKTQDQISTYIKVTTDEVPEATFETEEHV
jgi:PKD repeat protein